MESHQRESKRHTRRHSKNLLQDLLSKGVQTGHRDTPTPGELMRDAKTVQSIASIINGQSRLLLLESPDTVEVYKLPKAVAPPGGGRGDKPVYLPSIPAKASSLGSVRAPLSLSCPYLSSKRRASFSSTGSHRTGEYGKQSTLKALKEAKRSNVTVTMTYLGQGHPGSGLGLPADELKVLQQICGGENLRVFKGLVKAGEQFQFVSQRHRGFPFSASLYVNGMAAARMSSCCEYRYAPGFQQGRGSCFRLAWLSGGMPCYRCTSVRNKSSSCQQLNRGAKENFREPPLDQTPINGDGGSCPSSPLFVPVKPEKASRPRRKQRKEDSSRSTDSQASDALRHNRKPKRHRGPSGHGDDSKESGERGPGSRRSGEPSEPSESEGPVSSVQKRQSQRKKTEKAKDPRKDHQESNNTVMVSDSLQDEEALSKQNGKKERDLGWNEKSRPGERWRDFYEECVEMSAGLDLSPNKQNCFKANILERRRLQKRLSSAPKATSSDVEPSEESDSPPAPDTHPGDQATEDQATEDQATEDQATEDQATEDQATEDQATEDQATEDQATEDQATEDQATEDQATEDQATEDQATEDQATEDQATEDQATEDQATEDKPGAVPEHDLQTQLNAMMTVLNWSDEVEQLVLRNTGLTDDLLQSLAQGLKASPSKVTLLNLNLNHVGPYGSLVLLDLLRAKPQVRALLLFGNRLGDSGVLTLLSGLAELQTREPDQSTTSHPEFSSLLASGVSVYNCVLLELDLGGNGLSGDGLKVLASYMRHYSQLQYLGLAQTRAGDPEAWAELFQSIKGNPSLYHIILDESDLGDVGVRLFADMLMANWSLRKVDLDCVGVGEVGGGDLLTALLCRGQAAALHHLSLERNQVSDGLMSLIQQEVRRI